MPAILNVGSPSFGFDPATDVRKDCGRIRTFAPWLDRDHSTAISRILMSSQSFFRSAPSNRPPTLSEVLGA
jgi:hypothetical protein